ncbi:hypothetical protein [Vibrio sp. MA40-2]|uniref:hypothetical protein n=1 Tax=Vibrio sp. MA40-2 TaxID=3391828 RepID=UPI0039A62F3B
MKKQFACAVDAEQAMSDFASQCHLLGFAQSTIVKEPIYSGRGPPVSDYLSPLIFIRGNKNECKIH